MSFVEAEEVLYRRVLKDRGYSYVAGSVVFSASAFNDAQKKPSVDRASLRNSPEETKWQETDGVTHLRALDARAIVLSGAPGGGNFAVDVVHREIVPDNPDRLPANPAHAQIETTPEPGTARFDKLKEALAKVASRYGWTIRPAE